MDKINFNKKDLIEISNCIDNIEIFSNDIKESIKNNKNYITKANLKSLIDNSVKIYKLSLINKGRNIK